MRLIHDALFVCLWLGLTIGGSSGCIPAAPLSATHVHIARYRLDAASRSRVDEKKLVVDLLSGRASLTDTDGRVYPSQLPDGMAQRLRTIIATRSFRSSHLRAPRDARDVRQYELNVYDGQQAVGRRTSWAVPPAKPIPESLALVTRVFDRADRIAHPLSEWLNLIE